MNEGLAPDFTLIDTNKNEVSLDDFTGKNNVVLLFFPLAFSSVCTKELCSTRDNMKMYDALDASVLAISVDSHYALKAFKEAQNYNFTLLSDFNKEVSRDYNVLYEDFYGMKGVSKRAVFVIDKNRNIIHSEILEDSSKIPDLDRVQEVLSSVNSK